jgi:hypothetical protein
MVEQGWSRKYVNAQIDRVRRMFRWASSEQLLPAGWLARKAGMLVLPGRYASQDRLREPTIHAGWMASLNCVAVRAVPALPATVWPKWMICPSSR